MNWYIKIAQDKKLILIRGISGTGKSSLAESLAPASQIFATDDFFMVNGEYKFDTDMLSKAHLWNQSRVRRAMVADISPIVVPNTSAKFWEMKAYVSLAKAHGYDIEFAEPNWHPGLKTPEGKWNVDFLSGKNTHNVDKKTLQEMADKYEHGPSIDKVLQSKAPWE